MQRYTSGELGSAGVGVRTTIEKSKFLRGVLKTMGVLAVSMILSDGILTPAQSVLGAVQGLNVAVDNLSKSTIVGKQFISCSWELCLTGRRYDLRHPDTALPASTARRGKALYGLCSYHHHLVSLERGIWHL
jgi:hypothetical protein